MQTTCQVPGRSTAAQAPQVAEVTSDTAIVSYPASFQPQACANQTNLSIISNSVLLREGVIALIRPLMNLALVGSYSSDAPLAAALPNPPDHVVLLDGGMGEQLTVRWIRHWCAATPAARTMVVELADDAGTILACIEAGAVGYTLRGISAADLVAAIDQIQRGLAECSPEVTARMFQRLADLRAMLPQPDPALPQLTARELEVLQYLAADYSNQQIADLLVIEVRTVKHHVHNILEKLKLRRRWDAARFAQERGLIASDVPPLSREAET